MLTFGAIDTAATFATFATFATRTVTVPPSLLVTILALGVFGLTLHALGAFVPILALFAIRAFIPLMTRTPRPSLLLAAIRRCRRCFRRSIRRRCRRSGFRCCRLDLLMTMLAAWPMRATVSAACRPPHFDER